MDTVQFPVSYGTKQRGPSAARIPASLGRSEYVNVEPQVRLHVTDLGEGHPVVLLHGWPLSNAMYEYQYTDLVAAGYRVIGISLRGFGQSDKSFGSYSYDMHADDIKAVLTALSIQYATLGGYSMGGALAIRYMTRHQGAHVSKLALFSATAPSSIQRANYPHSFFRAEDINGMIELSLTNRPLLIETFRKTYMASLPNELATWLATISLEASPYATTQSLIAMRDADLRAELSDIDVPVAIFHGVNDTVNSFAGAEQLRSGLRQATIVPFENSGHILFYEEREKFNAELIRFIRDDSDGQPPIIPG